MRALAACALVALGVALGVALNPEGGGAQQAVRDPAGLRGPIRVEATFNAIRIGDLGDPGISVGDVRTEVLLIWERPRGDFPIGTAYIVCVFLGRDGLLGNGAWDCSFNLHMPLGKIRAAGIRRRTTSYHFPVLGGTRYYDGVTGTLSVGRSFPGRLLVVVERKR